MLKKKFLLSGHGGWGKNFFRELAEHPQAQIGAVANNNADFHKALSSQTWDGVIIASPAKFHTEQLKKTLQNKVPTLIEKPLCLDLQEAIALQMLSLSTKTPVLVDHIYLFHSSFIEMKENLLVDGTAIKEIHSEGGNWGPFRKNCPPLWDYGPHELALLLDLVGLDVELLNIKQEHIAEGCNYELKFSFDQGMATLKFGNAFKKRERKMMVITEKNSYFFSDSSVVSAAASPLNQLIQCFIDGLNGKSDQPFSSRWGLALAVKSTEILSQVSQTAV